MSEISDIYTIAFSLAGEDKIIATKLANSLKERGISYWIYTEHEAELAGSDQPVIFENIFVKQSKYCLILISKDYIRKNWTGLEKQYIIARWMKDKNYLIPIKLDDSKLNGLPDTIGYISMKNRTTEDISQVIINKIIGKNIGYPLNQQKTNFRLPKVIQDFDPLNVRNEWISSIIENFNNRSIELIGMSISHDEIGNATHIRVRLKGKNIYSLNIYKKGYSSNDDGISFYGTEGDMRSSESSTNAMGNFTWSKNKEAVVLELLDFSLLEIVPGEKKRYTKEEFIDALWNKICDIIDNKY